VRRTKEDAEKTRCRIMSAALRTFNRHGIACTTMEHIAQAARVTRGAIYWHFTNKRELFRAIREDISLPLIDRADYTLLSARECDPLDRIRRFLLDVIHAIDQDSRVRLAYCVMSYKCEYVGDLKGELADYVRKIEHARGVLTRVYKEAGQRGDLRAGLTPDVAALETTVFLVGLMRLCLLEQYGTRLRKQAAQLIEQHVAGRLAVAVGRTGKRV
jgi:TetR/AcrR family transcriptional regulator, acrAB operon repressor